MKSIILFVYRFFYLFLAIFFVASIIFANKVTENMFFYILVLLGPTLVLATTLFFCVPFIEEEKQVLIKGQLRGLEFCTAFLWVAFFLVSVMVGVAALFAPLMS